MLTEDFPSIIYMTFVRVEAILEGMNYHLCCAVSWTIVVILTIGGVIYIISYFI